MPELNVIGIVSTAIHICLNKFELEESLTEAFIDSFRSTPTGGKRSVKSQMLSREITLISAIDDHST